MDDNRVNAEACTRWVGPYRSVGEELIAPVVEEALRRRLFRGRVMTLAGMVLLLGPCPLGGWVLTSFDAGTSRPGAADTLFVGTILTVIALFAPAVLLLRDGIRGWRVAGRGLRSGRVERFVLDERAGGELRALAALGRSVPKVPASILVLRPRPRLAMVGEELARFEPVRVSELAEPTERSGGQAGERRLSTLELAELGGLVDRMGSLRNFVPSSILLYFVLGGIGWMIRGWMNWPLGVFWAIMVLLFVRSLGSVARVRAVRAALRRDLRAGMARIVLNAELRERVKGQSGPEIIPEYIEELPESEALWVVDGMPAPWRQNGR